MKQNAIDNEKAFKEWIESHTPDQIRIANNARRMLGVKTSKRKWPTLKDHRVPKYPGSAFVQFTRERWASGDLKGIKIADAGALLKKEYNELSDAARKVSLH